MVSANKNPSKRAAVGMTSHLCGRNVSSVRMAFATNGRWTYWDRATIELKSNKDRELPNEPNRPVKPLRAGREISRLGSSLSEKTPRPIHPKPICFTIICNACLPPGALFTRSPSHEGLPVNIQRKSVAAPVDFTMGERLEIDRLRFALERDFGHGFSAG